MHYSYFYNDVTYNDTLVTGCIRAGICAFTGDVLDEQVLKSPTTVIKQHNGLGIPTIKPWNIEVIKEKMKFVNDSNAFAIAKDIDAAGLRFLKNQIPPAGSKSVTDMKEIRALSNKPFIIKGNMSVEGVLKALEAGASGIVVSNHGGRVLDCTPSTASVLPLIVNAVQGKMKIFVDGGIRSGMDVFKALALGAAAVLLARPFLNVVYGDSREGI